MRIGREAVYQEISGSGGVLIACWALGSGPPLLLVHGSLGDHTRWDVLVARLLPHFSVYSIDRRGRGFSGDGGDYRIDYEYHDIAAVVDHIAAEADGEVNVYGHSYGGVCVFGATAHTSNISRLVLYEGWPPPDPGRLAPSPGLIERMEALLEEGQHEAVIETALVESAGLTERELEAYRAQPSWTARVNAAPTYPREERWFARTSFDPLQAARIDLPVLLLVGEETPGNLWEPDTVQAALPNARISVLDGQAHAADVVAPDAVASELVSFLGTS